ncbi:thiamine phosphate synthase [Ramlibacter rhizophilus]|uniref:Thiamine phosphate synthase n=1 Tax=Ramlibacter rhizophilus TaxID=1781167 RepID=A0A4Z0BIQ9_9BURK|nr:thiamine phosphate synthase [Ramlibacter rhizophilus]TFY98660.1 thiamine phosphate synthase [Ramlibacter rhizophilus]
MNTSLSIELLGARALGLPAADIPAHAAGLRARGGATVCVLDVPQPSGGSLHWLEAGHARGWVRLDAAAPGDLAERVRAVFPVATRRGFVAADAALLALHEAHGGELPRLSWGDAPRFEPAGPVAGAKPMGLYALVDSAARLAQVIEAGVHSVQVRIKTPRDADAAWQRGLHEELARCVALAREAGVELIVNDHQALAAELGAPGVHLGQEDLLALGDEGRAALLARGLTLGISSHSVWELCRARALAPRYIACGPVWPTTTKDMPWVPQGLDNLAWWCGRAGAPVVAIGGILEAPQVRAAAAAGADGVCIVRGLGEVPARVVPALREAFEAGRAEAAAATVPAWPHPSLPAGEGA